MDGVLKQLWFHDPKWYGVVAGGLRGRQWPSSEADVSFDGKVSPADANQRTKWRTGANPGSGRQNCRLSRYQDHFL